MAEIKSTLEMVLERAARMSENATGTPAGEEAEQRGMRLAAGYLNGDSTYLMSLLDEQPPQEQMAVRNGMARTLLRNIVLPRDEDLFNRSKTSLKGLQEISGQSGDIMGICSELSQLLDQYSQHKEQMKQQLDDTVRQQLKQGLFEQGQMIEDDMTLNPAMHPHYHEKVSRRAVPDAGIRTRPDVSEMS